MKENFPHLAKEIDLQEVQEDQRVPKKLGPRRNTQRYIIITLAMIKDKERILKAARERRHLLSKKYPLDYQLFSQKNSCRQEGAGKK